ncbi:MFS transporter [Sphingomonas sp. LR61]|uniref:MFS transporter n=1 Tax=Sphingomonas sp. LR61 TaxID=3050234 RepID=UPI003FA73727
MVPLIIGAAALAAFVVVELRHQHPLLRLGLLRNVTLVHANLAGFALFGSFASFQFLSTIYLQSSLGWSPLQTALGLLPIGVVVVIAAPRLVPVTVRLGTPVSILLGLLVCAGAYALFLRAEPGMLYIEFLFPTTVLSGIGFSLAFAAINAQATAGVSDSDQGLAGGLINTSLQVGTVTELAVVSGLFSTPTAGRSQVALPGQTSAVSAIIAALIAAVILTVALIVVQAIARRRRVTPSPDPEEPA